MIQLNFDERGLIPAIVQHARSGEILMLGYMNAESLAMTQTTGHVTFWSRSRRELWTKGATSGNYLNLVAMRTDCDRDALLILAEPVGATCHTGDRSCFATMLDGEHSDDAPVPATFGAQLHDLLLERQRTHPEGSYTTYLLNKGVDKIGKKIGEESAEVIIAAKNNDAHELTNEASDLIYHLYVMLVNQGVSPDDIWRNLRERHGEKRMKDEG